MSEGNKTVFGIAPLTDDDASSEEREENASTGEDASDSSSASGAASAAPKPTGGFLLGDDDDDDWDLDDDAIARVSGSVEAVSSDSVLKSDDPFKSSASSASSQSDVITAKRAALDEPLPDRVAPDDLGDAPSPQGTQVFSGADMDAVRSRLKSMDQGPASDNESGAEDDDSATSVDTSPSGMPGSAREEETFDSASREGDSGPSALEAGAQQAAPPAGGGTMLFSGAQMDALREGIAGAEAAKSEPSAATEDSSVDPLEDTAQRIDPVLMDEPPADAMVSADVDTEPDDDSATRRPSRADGTDDESAPSQGGGGSGVSEAPQAAVGGTMLMSGSAVTELADQIAAAERSVASGSAEASASEIDPSSDTDEAAPVPEPKEAHPQSMHQADPAPAVAAAAADARGISDTHSPGPAATAAPVASPAAAPAHAGQAGQEAAPARDGDPRVRAAMQAARSTKPAETETSGRSTALVIVALLSVLVLVSAVLLFTFLRG